MSEFGVKLIRDGAEVAYRMRWVRGLELFGRVTRGGVVIVTGRYTWGVVRDWLMDQGYEVVVE